MTRKLYALTDDEIETLRTALEDARYADPSGTFDALPIVERLQAGASATIENGWSRTCPTCGTWVEPDDVAQETPKRKVRKQIIHTTREIIADSLRGPRRDLGPDQSWVRAEDVNAAPERDDAAEAVNAAMAPFIRYVEMRRARPLKGLGDTLHTIHVGTEWEASINVSDIELLMQATGAKRPDAPTEWLPTAAPLTEARGIVDACADRDGELHRNLLVDAVCELVQQRNGYMVRLGLLWPLRFREVMP